MRCVLLTHYNAGATVSRSSSQSKGEERGRRQGTVITLKVVLDYASLAQYRRIRSQRNVPVKADTKSGTHARSHTASGTVVDP